MKIWNRSILRLCVCHPCYQCVSQHVPLLVAELLIYHKKYFLIKQNKIINLYKNPYLSIVDWFRPIFNNIEATLKQSWYDIITTLYKFFSTLSYEFVSTLSNVENLTSDFVSFSTPEKRYLNVDPQRWNSVDPTFNCWIKVYYFCFIKFGVKE